MKTLTLALALAMGAGSAHAHDAALHKGGIQSKANSAVRADFDIVHTKITTDGNVLS